MNDITAEIINRKSYLGLLANRYPTIRSVCTEIINLRAILNLPKGTEHFLSDLHGEYEAFCHIINNCSGIVREKIDAVFAGRLTEQQRAELATLVYYPDRKLERVQAEVDNLDEWYEIVLRQLIDLCKSVANKYTRSKVRKAMPPEYSYIIDELLHADYQEQNQSLYYQKIIESILSIRCADDFIISLATLIKRLAVDRLHIVGDIFDRGPRPDRIMDLLMNHHNVDIQWGNHDILWMGAALGNEVCCAAVLTNSAAFGNLAVLEQGYAVNLRPLALFAEKTYGSSSHIHRRAQSGGGEDRDEPIESKMYKALAVMMFKLEGQLYLRRPEYKMEERLLLDKIDREAGTVTIGGRAYALADRELPTLDPSDPYALTGEEARIMAGLRDCFLRSTRLQEHVRFLYQKGSMYRIYNHNLLFHGCIPMEEDGSFERVWVCGEEVCGKALLDRCDMIARTARSGAGSAKKEALDFMWYLWCGKGSPLFGRSCMTTFERLFVSDESTWAERKNHYYAHIRSREQCLSILHEFGLESEIAHIINGHVPVMASQGESPVKGGGKLVVIDGGFCRAYQPKTGIAGYTLIFNSWGMRLSAHHPFESAQQALENNADIHSTTSVFETMQRRMLVMDTDIGQDISERIYALSLLLTAYREGKIQEKSGETLPL